MEEFISYICAFRAIAVVLKPDSGHIFMQCSPSHSCHSARALSTNDSIFSSWKRTTVKECGSKKDMHQSSSQSLESVMQVWAYNQPLTITNCWYAIKYYRNYILCVAEEG